MVHTPKDTQCCKYQSPPFTDVCVIPLFHNSGNVFLPRFAISSSVHQKKGLTLYSPTAERRCSWTYRAADISTFAFESGTRSLAREVEAIYIFFLLCFAAFLACLVSPSSSSNFLKFCSASCTTTNMLTCKDGEIFNLGHNFEECLLEFFSLLFLKTGFVTQPCGTSQRLLLVQAKTV